MWRSCGGNSYGWDSVSRVWSATEEGTKGREDQTRKKKLEGQKPNDCADNVGRLLYM
jgi:hypothetical protein